MVFLPVPFQSTCWVSWNNVASSFGCFCVQERTKAGEAKNESIGYRLLSAEEDLKSFRIIYSTFPADFATTEAERQRVHARSTSSTSGTPAQDGGTNTNSGEPESIRSVIAVGNTLAAILADWSLLLKSWPAVYAVPGHSTTGKPLPTASTLTERDWQPVYAHMKEKHTKGEVMDSCPPPSHPSPPPGNSKSAAKRVAGPQQQQQRQQQPQQSARAGAPTAKELRPTLHSSNRDNSKASASAKGPAMDISSAYFDVYDSAVLQLCDLFAWRCPQLSFLVLLAVCLGGPTLGAVFGASAAASGGSAFLLPWPAVLALLIGAALPLSDAQTHRRRVVLQTDVPLATASEAAVRAAEANTLAQRIATDERRLRAFARLTSTHGKTAKKKSGQKAAKPTATGTAAAPHLLTNPLFMGGVAVALTQCVLSVYAPSAAPSTLLDRLAAPTVAIALLVCGAQQLRMASLAPAATHKAKKATFVPVKVELKDSVSLASQAPASAAAPAPVQQPPKPAPSAPTATATAPPAEAVKPASARAPVPPPTEATKPSTPPPAPTSAANSAITTPAPSSVSGAGTTSTAHAYKYCLPALADKEATVLQQLANYGAPFSMVLLKPLREWNQTHGWETLWERDGLRCEERTGRGDALTVRLTANIPNSNVGALQAIMLDDPDFLDAKSTYAYQYSPLLSQRCVVKRLAYNMLILLTRHRSPVYGVPPLELLHYVSPAVLLDPEQQQLLELRRPFAGALSSSGAGSPTSEVVMPLDENGKPRPLMTFVQCGIPCPIDLHATPPCQPPHVRGATELSLVIGMEEPDGSLTLGVYDSINPKGIIPKEWQSVFRSIAVRKAGKIAELLGQEGPQPNRLAVYQNQRDFQPFLERQPLSEPEPQPSRHRSRAAAAAARRMGNLSREAQFYTSGNALFTADMEATMPTPTKTHGSTLSGAFPPLPPGASGDAPATSPTAALFASHSFGTLTTEPKFPKLPQRFVQELLTLPGWTPEVMHGRTASSSHGNLGQGGAKGAVRCWSCQTPFCARKAAASLVLVPGVTLALTEAVLLVERVAPECNPLIERRVTVTPANLPGLLVGAAISDPARGKGSTTDLPTPDFPRDSYHGCSIHYTQFRSPMWGVAPRDTVTRVAEPYYFTTGDARRSLFTPEQFEALPLEIRQLPDTTRMMLFCGEDASEVLPPMKQYQRGKVYLFGYVCWELEDVAGAGPGVGILSMSVAEAGGKLVSKLADKSISDQQQVAVRTRDLLQRISAGDNKIRLL